MIIMKVVYKASEHLSCDSFLRYLVVGRLLKQVKLDHFPYLF